MLTQIPEEIRFNYDLVKQIGEGSNGETWLIKNRVDKSLAALKCLKLNTVEDIKAVELFEREAALLKSIHIQGVPRFLQYLTDASDNGYLIQEYIPAYSIEYFIDKGYLFSEEETLSIAQKLASIIYQLQTQYSPPIIHRDIKPSNILYDNQHGNVYLIDFGSVAHPQKRTGGSTVAGTFGYMAPEQILGNVAIQSDYYSLGATMLHMLTGVFPGNIESDMFQLDFVPVIQDKAPDTSKWMISILKSLLSKDPEDRSENAIKLIEKLSTRPQKTHFFKRIIQKIQSSRNSLSLPQPIHPPQADDSRLCVSNPFHIITIQDTEKNANLVSAQLLTSTWKLCKGTVHRIVQSTVSTRNNKGDEITTVYHALEYTFNAQNSTWLGRCVFSDAPKNITFPTFPIPCEVIYSTAAPAQNAIYSLTVHQKSENEP